MFKYNNKKILSKTAAKNYVVETCNMIMNKYPAGILVKAYKGKDFTTFVTNDGKYIIPKYDIYIEGYNDFLYTLEELISPEGPNKQKEIDKTWDKLYKDNNLVDIEEEREGRDLTIEESRKLAQYLNNKINCKMACSIESEDINKTIVVYSGNPLTIVKGGKIEFDPFEKNILNNLSKKLPKPLAGEVRYEFDVTIDFGASKATVRDMKNIRGDINMNCFKVADILVKTALSLNPNLHLSSTKYPKDLGSWGMDETNIDELIRHLKRLTVELKIYDIDDEEFPDFKGKNLVEVELKSDQANSKKVLDILKRVKAFPLEEHHIINLKRKKLKTEEFLEASDNSNVEVEEIVKQTFDLNSRELNKNFSDLKAKTTYSDRQGTKILEISGTINKDWINKNYGEDYKIDKIEKQLSKSYYGGPGQSFSEFKLSLKPKNSDQYKFTIVIHSGLDI